MRDCLSKVGDLPDMSQDIVQEVVFFLHSILMGLVITFAYDWILIFRELVAHGRFLMSIPLVPLRHLHNESPVLVVEL